MKKLKLAILDLYNGIPNQGMRCIREIADQFADSYDYRVFDTRSAAEVPDMTFDAFISSGGPGDPIKGEGAEGWEAAWAGWLDEVVAWNKGQERKKYVFFICHSFQMAVHHFKIAQVTKRKGIGFGTFPIHLNKAGKEDPLFKNIDNPFWAADFRRFQVVRPDKARLKELGATVLGREKIRPHVDLERAIMAVRWSPEIVGVQFHPEADPDGMLVHFSRTEVKQEVIADHGRKKWLRIMEDLQHPERIKQTYDHILPGFLGQAIDTLVPSELEEV